MSHVRRRFALLFVLIAVPLLLAWYMAAKRSWLPLTRSIGTGPIKQITFERDGQSLTVVGWEKSNSLRADLLAADTLHPLKPLARFSVPLLKGRVDLISPRPILPGSSPTPAPSSSITLKNLYGFLSNEATFSPNLRLIADLVNDDLPVPLWQSSLPHYNHVEVRDALTRKLRWKSDLKFTFYDLKFSPRGAFMTTIKEGKCVLQNTRDFRRVPLADPHWDYAAMAEFSPDERWLVGAAEGGQFRLWDTQTGRIMRALSRRTPKTQDTFTQPYTLAFSSDSRLLASADATHTICVWELATGKLRRALHGLPKGEGALAFAPDADLLAIADENTVTLWNWRANTKLRTMTLRVSPTKRTVVTTLAWSPDGNVLVSGYEDGTIARWRIK